MTLTVPDPQMMEDLRQQYTQHLQDCQALIDAIPEQHRMARRNSGFHVDASAVAALGRSLGRNDIKLLEVGVWKAATLTYFLKKQALKAKRSVSTYSSFRTSSSRPNL